MAALADLISSQFNFSATPEAQEPPSVYLQGDGEGKNMSGSVGDSFSEPFTLISSTAESFGAVASDQANARGFLGHIKTGKDWIASKHAKVQPWSEFFSPRSVSWPKGAGEVTSRLLGNLLRFQSNYLFVFLGLIVYCM